MHNERMRQDVIRCLNWLDEHPQPDLFVYSLLVDFCCEVERRSGECPECGLTGGTENFGGTTWHSGCLLRVQLEIESALA